MPNVPASVKHFEINGRHTVGGADSADADVYPDAYGTFGLVRFTPIMPDDRPLIAVTEQEAVSLATVTCRLFDGYLYAPLDGMDASADPDPDPELYAPGVSLVASKQPATQPASWWWMADFLPAPSERWKQFTLVFQSVPDEVLTIAQLILQSPPVAIGTTFQQMWFLVGAFPTSPVTSANLPAGFRPGIDILLNTTTKQYAEVY